MPSVFIKAQTDASGTKILAVYLCKECTGAEFLRITRHADRPWAAMERPAPIGTPRSLSTTMLALRFAKHFVSDYPKGAPRAFRRFDTFWFALGLMLAGEAFELTSSNFAGVLHGTGQA